MSDNRKNRKELLHENLDPINFTCGRCNKVVPFKEGYKCENCDKEEVEESGD